MGGAHFVEDVVERWPKPLFRSIEQLDRIRHMKLGLPVARTSGNKVPWGYEVREGEPGMLYPIEEDFKALLQAASFIRSCSYGEISRWLSEKTGRYISDNGLHKLMRERYPFKEIDLPYEERVKLGASTTPQVPKEKDLPFSKKKD